MDSARARGEPQPLLLVTGVPGAGKTTLGAALASALAVPFLSLDSVKEALYDPGTGDVDRHRLRLAAEEEISTRLGVIDGGVVVDIWVAPGRDTDRVAALLRELDRNVIELICRVPPAVAVARYLRRQRSGPHLPPDDATLQRIRDATDVLAPLGVGRCIELDTSRPVNVDQLVERLRSSGPAPAVRVGHPPRTGKMAESELDGRN